MPADMRLCECSCSPYADFVALIVFSSKRLWKFVNHLKGRGLAYILISDIRTLWRSGLSARVPECQKLKMAG